MPRPLKQRMVAGRPVATVYKPAGIPARQLRWMHLTLDEFEAIRLVDGQGLDQETVATHMGVSRPTVTRILASARGKIAQTFIHGQALVIEGGPVVQVPMAPIPGGWGGGGPGRGRGGRRWRGGRPGGGGHGFGGGHGRQMPPGPGGPRAGPESI